MFELAETVREVGPDGAPVDERRVAQHHACAHARRLAQQRLGERGGLPENLLAVRRAFRGLHGLFLGAEHEPQQRQFDGARHGDQQQTLGEQFHR
jgi:hypothetical protein